MDVGRAYVDVVPHVDVGRTHVDVGPTCTWVEPRARENEIFFQKSNNRVMFLIHICKKFLENSDFWKISILKLSNTTSPYYFEKK